MNAITTRRSGLFFKIIMVIFIILYFNIIVPSHKSTSSTSQLFNYRGQEVTDIHLAPTVRLYALQSTGHDNSFIHNIPLLLLTHDAKAVAARTLFIDRYVIHPWCALTTINAP